MTAEQWTGAVLGLALAVGYIVAMRRLDRWDHRRIEAEARRGAHEWQKKLWREGHSASEERKYANVLRARLDEATTTIDTLTTDLNLYVARTAAARETAEALADVMRHRFGLVVTFDWSDSDTPEHQRAEITDPPERTTP